CHRLGRDRPCLVIVGVFGTCLVLFGISPKLPKYLPRTLAWVHAHYHINWYGVGCFLCVDLMLFHKFGVHEYSCCFTVN
ncbi:hypothetical protein HETIRDRAFT_309333, partial [Heterobasidion irregulare TC 32-1]